MSASKDVYCLKCGKKISGVTICVGRNWTCSDCTEDKEEPIYCEEGCKVVADFEGRSDGGGEQVKGHLEHGKVYEVKAVDIGAWFSYIKLKEVPERWFNSVLFKRIS